jgi:hypothetical protein
MRLNNKSIRIRQTPKNTYFQGLPNLKFVSPSREYFQRRNMSATHRLLLKKRLREKLRERDEMIAQYKLERCIHIHLL